MIVYVNSQRNFLLTFDVVGLTVQPEEYYKMLMTANVVGTASKAMLNKCESSKISKIRNS